MKIKNLIKESPRDKHIFKVIFMAGIPGAGKSTVSDIIKSGTSLKYVDFDKINSYLKNIEKTDNIINQQISNYINGRLGLLIDKTSQDYNKIIEMKENLESLGYQCMMVYVNTDLETAKTRVEKRYKETGRNVSPEYIDKAFKNLSNNLGKYQIDFGRDFIIVDNSENINKVYLESRINKFLNSPITSQKAKEWLQKTP